MKAENYYSICATVQLFIILVSTESNLYNFNKDFDSPKNRHKIKKLCLDGYFIENENNKLQCKLCSVCPQDQIIRKMCSLFNDTICGPFYEFKKFNQEKEIEISHSFSDMSMNVNEMNIMDINHADERTSPNRLHKSIQEDIFLHENKILSNPVTDSTFEDESSIWRKMSFGLVGVLIFMTFVVVTYEVFSIIRNKRKKVFNEFSLGESNVQHHYQNSRPLMNCFGIYKNSWLFKKICHRKVHDVSQHAQEIPPLLPLFLLSNNIERAVDNNYVPEPCKQLKPIVQIDNNTNQAMNPS